MRNYAIKIDYYADEIDEKFFYNVSEAEILN